MASVGKKVVKYNLELTESEYFSILCLLGGISYLEYKDYVNRRHSIRLGRAETENFEVLSHEDYTKLYNTLDDNK